MYKNRDISDYIDDISLAISDIESLGKFVKSIQTYLGVKWLECVIFLFMIIWVLI